MGCSPFMHFRAVPIVLAFVGLPPPSPGPVGPPAPAAVVSVDTQAQAPSPPPPDSEKESEASYREVVNPAFPFEPAPAHPDNDDPGPALSLSDFATYFVPGEMADAKREFDKGNYL